MYSHYDPSDILQSLSCWELSTTNWNDITFNKINDNYFINIQFQCRQLIDSAQKMQDEVNQIVSQLESIE